MKFSIFFSAEKNICILHGQVFVMWFICVGNHTTHETNLQESFYDFSLSLIQVKSSLFSNRMCIYLKNFQYTCTKKVVSCNLKSLSIQNLSASITKVLRENVMETKKSQMNESMQYFQKFVLTLENLQLVMRPDHNAKIF